MKSNELRLLQTLQMKLRGDAFRTYTSVMHELFQHHESYDFVRELSGHFRSGAFDKALRLADSLSEQKYTDATTHFVANQFALLIRKYPWDPRVVKTDPEAMAIKTFLRSERKCYLLNKKFRLYDTFRSPNEILLSRMRSFIQKVIGAEPPLDQVLDSTAFGAGASLGIHGNATNLSRKILAKTWTVTPGAAIYGYWAVMRNPHLADCLRERKGEVFCHDVEVSKTRFWQRIRTVRNNKITFVPKTAKTHRAIAVEPLLNGLVQKGADLFMRKRLKRIGVDLSDQSKNQRLAHLGSINDSDTSFVTIDLSSASDSISCGLVRSVLPPGWFEFLNSIRSPCFELEGKQYTYSKFCSMGNGFCFPLESLLFAACCHAVGCGVPGTDFSVYGDDIIVRKQFAGDVLRSLKILGFTPNANKTFLEGSFRESCGSDWFNGKDVRPYTLDYALDSLENVFKWLNLTRRNDYTSRFFDGSYSSILDKIPTRFQFVRPHKGDPDTGIDAFGSEYLTSPNCYFDRRKQFWRCKALRHTGVLDRVSCEPANRHSSVDMYALLSGAKSKHYDVVFTVRRKTRTTITFTGCSGATSMWLPRI